MNAFCLFSNAIYESKQRGYSKEEENFWEEFFTSIRSFYLPKANYTDEEINKLGNEAIKKVVKKYHYDNDYVILTYCDILETCFTEEEKEMNKDFLQSMRDQVSEE